MASLAYDVTLTLGNRTLHMPMEGPPSFFISREYLSVVVPERVHQSSYIPEM